MGTNSIPLHRSVWSTPWVPSPWLRAGRRLKETQEAPSQIGEKQQVLCASPKSWRGFGSTVQGWPGQGGLPGARSSKRIRPKLRSPSRVVISTQEPKTVGSWLAI